MAEEWRPVAGYEGAYAVSSLGRVRSLGRLDSRGHRRAECMLRPRSGHRGHLYVALYRATVREEVAVHHLVLTAFVGPRPEGADACHWNDDGSDNRVSNLRWDTRSSNVLDSVRNGRHAMAGRTECPSGHPYTEENTYIYPRGSRACRECRRLYRETHQNERRENGREYMRRRRAATNLERV